jgi:hypothetical protein
MGGYLMNNLELIGIVRGNLDLIQLEQDRIPWWAVVDTVMNPQVL